MLCKPRVNTNLARDCLAYIKGTFFLTAVFNKAFDPFLLTTIRKRPTRNRNQFEKLKRSLRVSEGITRA